MSVVVINPEVGHTEGPEEALWYVAPYFEQLRDYLRTRAISYTYLYREDAVKDKVWEALKTKRTYFVGTGHGNESTFTGYALNKIFWVDMTADGFNTEWVRGTVFLMLSCLTGVSLGPWMTAHGAWSYLGWTVEYFFVANKGVRKGSDIISSPDLMFLKPIEEAFEKCAANEISPREAYNYIYQKYTEYAADPRIPPDVRDLLIHDRDNMVLLGMGTSPIIKTTNVMTFISAFTFTLGIVNIISGGKVLS